jgi:hypothetical protein
MLKGKSKGNGKGNGNGKGKGNGLPQRTLRKTGGHGES